MRTRTRAITLIALLACALGVHFWLDAMPVIERKSETYATAGDDGSLEVAGQRLTLRGAEWDEFPSPDGTRTVSIRLHSSGGAEAEVCGEVTLSEPGGRIWLDADDIVDVPSEEGEPYCVAESAPYDIVTVFVVPDDADGPFVLTIADGAGRAARFDIAF
ncbi:hypothetical protein [Microbacterium sp.]|uniref:hypothetical protein n=1 Tax=Microbacterium sp. TaxID=51671 RepID=UPI0039E6077C